MKKTPIKEIEDSLRRSGKIPRNKVSSKADELFKNINSTDMKPKENNKNNNSPEKSEKPLKENMKVSLASKIPKLKPKL